MSIDDYLASPAQYTLTEMAAIIKNESVPNHHGWNITRIQCINFGYATFENRDMNISIAHLYLLTSKDSRMEIVWWEIESMVVAYSRNTTDPVMPKKLEEKLLHGTNRGGSKHGGLGLSMILLIVGVVVCAVTGTAAWASTKYQDGSGRGIYRVIALDELLWEEHRAEDRELRESASRLGSLVASTHCLYPELEFLYDDARAIDQGTDLIKSVNGEAKDSRAAWNLVGIARDEADQMKVLTGLAEESKLRLGSRFRNRGSLIILKVDMI
ncbi:MAG: hypothetical protein Q9188_007195 [Gyalolechia gomerana]